MNLDKASNSSRIYTFGSLQIQHTNTLLLPKGEKSRCLLAYLILHPQVLHRREALANMLWPDAAPDRVRRNLSDVLYRLQKDIETEWLVMDAVNIAFQPRASLWVDVWEFDALIAGKTIDGLQKAVELYTNDLLPEIYDEWMVAERELRRSQYLAALEVLSEQYIAEGKLQQALLYVRKLILTEPLHEPAHQSYLRLLGRLKRFGEAIAHYDYLCILLRVELDTAPMVQTEAILQSLLRERDLENMPVVIEESGAFVGRKNERTTALTAVESMLNGSGGLLAVEGEAGIGKSRLLREIVSGARWRGAVVLQSQASETPGVSPFLPLVEALTPLVNGPHGKKIETSLAKETLAILAPLNPAWKTKEASHDLPLGQAGKRFYDALNLFGEILAQLAPMMLVLDDLHWASPVLWECLRAFATGFARYGGLLIMAYRRPEIEQLRGWATLQSWDRAGLLKTISLQGFTVEEVAQFTVGINNFDPNMMHAWTGGNPFFITQWLAEPKLQQPSKNNAISLRLQTLSSAARSALEGASVLGENIPYHLWTEVSELAPPRLASISDELMAHHWLEPSTTGYAFVHDLIRSTVYDSLEPLGRQQLHRRVAEALSMLEPQNLRARAFHFDQAGLTAEAAEAYRLAGEQDLARFAFREAQDALDRALALIPNTSKVERIEIALALAKACDVTGDRVRQESALIEALSLTTENDAWRLQALLENVQFNTVTGRQAEAESQLEAALALARDLHDDAREIEAMILFGNLAGEQGKWNEAHKWSLQVLERSQATGNRPGEGRALRLLGIATRAMGDQKESITWHEKAIEVYRELGDRFQVCIAQANLLGTLYELGAWDRLIAIGHEVISIREELGDRVGASNTRHNLSLAYYALGDYVTARQLLEQVIRDSEDAQMPRLAGLARNVLGLVAEREGNHEEALSLYRRALADAEALSAASEMAYVQHDLGAFLQWRNQPLDAIPHLEAAHAAWETQGNLQLRVKSEAFLGLAHLAAGERVRAEQLAEDGWNSFQTGVPVGELIQDWLWALHRLLMAVGRPEPANAVLRTAYAELQRQAQNISDPDMRQGFFKRVQLNREIVEAYDQLTDSPRVISLSLARKDVPLGRSLREDEFVTIQWTLIAPEDEAISGKVERRRHRLKRLLKEAALQNAAPTDEDLAHSLGVSRRTILRDMQFLARENPKPPTRKRK